jgi:pimeloyl-ACP methyl ester carboxylesterase
MVPLAGALASRGVRSWLLDPPGFGYSDKPRRALSIRELAAVVAEWLAATCGRPARVLGNSFGTQVAAALAADHPGAVGRLVLLSPTLSPAARQRLSWLRVVPSRDGACSPPSGRWRGRLLSRLHGTLGDEPPLRLLNVADYACASLLRAGGTLRSAALEPIEQALARVDVPVLVIRAEHDRLSSPAWAACLARLVPDGAVAALPGLGHDAFYQAPDAVAAASAAFLAAPAG